MSLRRKEPVDWDKLDDQGLWDYLRSGYEEALSELFVRHHQSLFRYGSGLIDDYESVEDGIQELFMNLWKGHNSLRRAQSVRVYLYVSLRRLILRQQNHRESRKKREQLYFKEEMEEHAPSVDQILISREMDSQLSRNLQACLQILPPRQQEAIFLRLNQGMTSDEIARVMEITNQRVRSLISESIQRLRAELLHKSF